VRTVDSASVTSVAALYCDHRAWLQGWLGRRLGCAADAADLVQDAFLRLLAKPCHFASVPEARSYLRRMANGLCVDLWRRRAIEQAWLDVLASQPEAVVPSVEQQAIVLEALYDIDALLRSLSTKKAQAFVLAVVCGMSYAEVAHELGVSVRMVGKYIASATLHCLSRA